MQKLLTGMKALYDFLMELLLDRSVTAWFFHYPRRSTPKRGENETGDHVNALSFGKVLFPGVANLAYRYAEKKGTTFLRKVWVTQSWAADTNKFCFEDYDGRVEDFSITRQEIAKDDYPSMVAERIEECLDRLYEHWGPASWGLVPMDNVSAKCPGCGATKVCECIPKETD